jgi:hypothetical protein
VGGLDVGAGVFGLLVVEYRSGNELLGALAFTIGFVALTLARGRRAEPRHRRVAARARAEAAELGNDPSRRRQ